MKTTTKKIILTGLSIFMTVLLGLAIFSYQATQKEQLLENIQNEALAELDERQGDYNEDTIVLSNTSHSQAESFAEKLNAKLRITQDGSFATLKFTDGRTIRDIYENDEYREYLSLFGIDYQASISVIHDDGSNEDGGFRHPEQPTSGYYDKKEVRDYLGYMNLENTWDYTKGSGITVAVIDTGIDTDHPEFEGRISEYSYNATEDKIVKDWILEDGSYDWSLIEDEQGHGTMVAGTLGASMNSSGMVGIAPEVNLIVIKAECDEKGNFKSTADLVFGLYYAIERDVSVVNMSFGGEGNNPYAEAAQLAYDSDIICVAAAGNNSRATPTYPAADKNVIGVGALADDSWELASYSNYGENTNVVAPGTVYTASMGGKYKTANGTSFASPLVAGAVALFCSQNYSAFDYLTEVLYASSYDLGDLGRDYYYGFGAVDVSAFILEERGTLTYDMMTDELDDQTALFIRNHTLQEMLEPERLYAVFDGWYYDPHYVEEVVYYEDRFISDVTIYAKWVSEDDEIPFTYRELEDGTIEIMSYRGRRRFISVPEYIDGKLVSSIGADAFAGETNLREVNLPSGLNNIGASAFSGCSNLTKIELPQKVKTIGDGAFSGDIRLSAVIFADNSAVEYIGNDAFADCSNLRRFEVPEKVTYLNGSAFFGTTAMGAFSVHKNNKNFVAEDGVLFNVTKSTLIAYPANLTRSYAVPDSVKTIDSCAFGYTRADSVTLGKVQIIGGSAFQNSGLTSIIIPDSVKTLGISAFACSSYLSEVSLGKGLSQIEEKTFTFTSINNLVIPKGITSIGVKAFYQAGVNSIEFEEGSKLNSIGYRAFKGCCMQSLHLPKSLITLGSESFSKCFILSELTFEIGSNLKTIGSYAFAYTFLSELTFENGSNLKTIGSYAFAYTLSLTSVNLPDSLENIGDFAFIGSGLTGEIDIPEKVSYFGEGAFAACEKLQSFNVADENGNYNDIAGVVYTEMGDCLVAYPTGNQNYEYYVLSGTEKIGGASFYGAAYVNYIYLNAEIVEIDDYAFAYASALYNMQIPENTVKIGRYSFAYTPSLYEISFSENAKIARLGYASLANSGIRTLRIPKNVSTMAQYVFAGCSNLQAVIFASGNKLESISAYMFDGCENLYSITFEEGSALTSIQAHALEGMKNLQYIDFGDAKVTNIDNFAFRFCEGLTSFKVPETVTNIGRYAFYYCKNLHEITIPASIEHIGSYAFIGTNELEIYFESETLPAYLDEDWDHGIKGYYIGVTNVVTEGDWQYATLASGDIAILKYTGNEKNIDLTNFPYGNVVTIGGSAFIFKGIENIILPDTLVTIQNEAFAYTKFTSITIPASVEFIGREAFYKTSLQNVTFANGSNLKTIEQSAFEKTENLQSITLPASLTTLGRATFKNSGLTSVSFEDGIGLTQIPKECFAYSDVTSITIPDSIVKIDDSAFEGCANLEKFSYGEQKLWLGTKAFYDSGLKEFAVSENLYVIEEFALTSLNNLTEFTVSENNDYYMGVDGLLLLKDGSKLISVPAGRTGSLTLPQSIEKIGFGALEGTELSEVIFPENQNLLCIANRAFFGAENLTQITIPSSVVSIDYYAFAYAKNLQTVLFEEGSRLTGVYEGAFYGCNNLSDIVLPDSIVEISDFVFYGCDKLTELPISETSGLKGIYSYAFAYTGLTELNLPANIIDIGDYAFMGCDLTSVIISAEKQRELLIGIGAFEGCNSLEYLEVPFIGASFEDYKISWFGYIFGAGAPEANQTYIPESLKTVKINGDITFIGNNAFYGVTSIDDLILPETVDTLYLGAFENSTVKYEIKQVVRLRDSHYVEGIVATNEFFGEGISGELILSESVKRLGNCPFFGCSNLTSITIPEGVTNIGVSTFFQCSSLTSITIPESVTSIEASAFSDCSRLTSIIIPNNVTSIGEYAFDGCSSLTSITIPDSVTSIGSFAFSGCNNLYKITVNSEYLSLDEYSSLKEAEEYGYLFSNAKQVIDSVKSVTHTLEDGFSYIDTQDGFRFMTEKDWEGNIIYKLIAYLGDEDTVTLPMDINGNSYQIYQMRGVKNVTIPEGVTSIGENAFFGCSSLTSITIPNGVINIGQETFNGCSRLTSITIPDNKMPSAHSIGQYFSPIPMTLKKVVLSKGIQMRGDLFKGAYNNITGVTIYVEDEEKDVRWDDNFPGWNNGNTVVYADKWINANFYDHNGEVLSSEIFTTSQVIRVPYLKIAGDAQYSYIVDGFDIDSDGIVDAVPATSTTDIEARAIVRQVVNTYTVNFFDGDSIYHSVTLPYGSTISLPETPMRSGYQFIGWNGYTEGMTVGGNINIYAKWQHHGDGHVYGESETVVPTCENQGFDKYTCTICGEWYGENYVDALGHDYAESEMVAPTCEEKGYTVYACSCGSEYSDNFVDALGHSFGDWMIKIAPTCTEDGLRVRFCGVCGHEETEVALAVGHNFNEKVAKQATCEKQGEIVYTCHCGFSVTEQTSMESHNYEKKYASKSFLKWLIEWLLNVFYGYEGEQAYYFKCTVCGHIATESEADLSYGASVKDVCVHVLGDWSVLSEANCQTGTVYGKVCSLCNETIELKIDSTLGEHSYNKVVTAPTCTEQGYTTYTCACGDSYVSDYVKETSHGYGEWYETQEATCLEKGAERRDCVNCDHYETREVVALGHAKVQHEAKSPTCTEHGWNVYETCTRCDYSTYEEIPATGHSYEKVVTAPTCMEQGYTTYTCHCGDTYVADYVEALGHTASEIVVENSVVPDCTNTGSYDNVTYCTVCGEELSRVTVTVEVLGHDKVQHTAKAATCTEDGWNVYETCMRCDYTTYEEIAALGHNFGEWKEMKAPTATEEGERERSCICGEIEKETIPTTDENADKDNSKKGCGGSIVGSSVGSLTLLCVAFVVFSKKRKES